MPLQIVFVENYIDNVYEDKVEFNQYRSDAVELTRVKMILTGNVGNLSKDTLKNKLMKRIMSKQTEGLFGGETSIYKSILDERETILIKKMKKSGIDVKYLNLRISNRSD